MEPASQTLFGSVRRGGVAVHVACLVVPVLQATPCQPPGARGWPPGTSPFPHVCLRMEQKVKMPPDSGHTVCDRFRAYFPLRSHWHLRRGEHLCGGPALGDVSVL